MKTGKKRTFTFLATPQSLSFDPSGKCVYASRKRILFPTWVGGGQGNIIIGHAGNCYITTPHDCEEERKKKPRD